MEADEDIGGAAGSTGPGAAAAATPGRDGVGALLRARRLELGLSHGDVAAVVKLPPRRIAAIEEERWEELPEGPYLRGFLRNVARALQLDAATLVDRVDQSRVRSRNPDSILMAPGSTHATLPRRSGPIEARHNGRALIYGAFAFALIAALIAWSGTASFDRAIEGGRALIAARSGGASAARVQPPAADLAATPAVPGPEASVAADGPLPTTDASTEERVASSGAPTTGATATPSSSTSLLSASASSTPSPASDAALSFHFNEPSWVEVRAADGKVLLKQLNDAGSDRQLGGEPPFVLIVGNAKGVALQFRGKPVDLVPYTRAAVARLTLP